MLSVRWGLSKYIKKTVVRWPEGTVVYHPFLNQTMMLEGEVELVFTALSEGTKSATELAKNEKLQTFLQGLNEELSLTRVELVLNELRRNELIEIAPLD